MKKQTPQKISSQEELDLLLDKNEGILYCFIALNFGCRSSKDIHLNEKGDYEIISYIDDSEETIKHDDLMKSFIGEAISKGALYRY